MVVIDKVPDVVPSLLVKGFRSTSLPVNKAKRTENPWLVKMMLSNITIITGAKPMDINFNVMSGIGPCDFNYIIFPHQRREGILFYPCVSVCLSICLSVHPSVCKKIFVTFSAIIHCRCLKSDVNFLLNVSFAFFLYSRQS